MATAVALLATENVEGISLRRQQSSTGVARRNMDWMFTRQDLKVPRAKKAGALLQTDTGIVHKTAYWGSMSSSP